MQLLHLNLYRIYHYVVRKSAHMTLTMLDEIHFVHTPHPRQAPRRESQKRAHAHAARIAHARRRHFRIIEYHSDEGGLKRGDGRRAESERAVTKSPSRKIARYSLRAIEAKHLPIPSPLTQLSADRTDPFASFARTINQTEQLLFDFCTSNGATTRIIRRLPDSLSAKLNPRVDIQDVIPVQSMECNKFCDRSKWNDIMNKEFTPLAITRGDSLDSIFLQASRYMSLCQRQRPEQHQRFLQLATEYKFSCLRALNEAISAEASQVISDATLMTVVVLAFDEVSAPRQSFCADANDVVTNLDYTR
jgi:hypothetical protein